MRRVAVIGGGTSCEHEVSLASAAGVGSALTERDWEIVPLIIGRDGGWTLHGEPLGLPVVVEALQSCAAVFPAVHGPHGEDGTLAALCDLAGVPCVGSGVGAGALAMDKWATKLVAESAGVATARGSLLRRGDPVPGWSGPVVVKPVAAGSSHGVSLAQHPGEVRPALERAWSLDTRVLVEQRLVGREIDVAVLSDALGREVSPALEIRTEGLFATEDKYGGGADFTVPADLSPTDRVALEAAATRVYDALGCAGVARVDFFLTADGPVLNEVNTMPGFTAHSQVPLMFAAAGIGYADLVDRLVRGVLA